MFSEKFGDVFAGYGLGFDSGAGWRIGWISDNGEWECDESNRTFIDFIADRFAEREG